ncbi:MAG: alpha/beta fold hydrolase [Huintestinicola sp.]
MNEKVYNTPNGDIHYWISKTESSFPTLVFLPGLTADHRLFDKQIEYFEGKYNILTWDAPGHAASRPFDLDISLDDKAKYLHGILEYEGIEKPLLIGQSMGGYVSQCYIDLYPSSAGGFISIDSAPLKRCYVTAAEIWLLKRMEPVYRVYPWKMLLESGSKGCAETEYGRKLMRDIMEVYTDAREDYCHIAGTGFKMLAEAMEADRPYNIDCPALLICGEHDKAGSAKRYNRAWSEKDNIPLVWIENAGHNSNTDAPEKVNGLIEKFIRENMMI